MSASFALGGCQSSCVSPVPNPVLPPPAALIDIHCHVFNVRDMPAYAFIMDVALNMPLLHQYGSPIAKLLVEIARGFAPDFATEQAALLAIRANPAAATALMQSPTFPAVLFAAGLANFITKYQPFPPGPPSPPTDEKKLIQALLDQFIPGVVDLSQPPAAIIDSITMHVPDIVAAMQNALTPGPNLDLKNYLAQFLLFWAPRLAYYRFQLVEELAAMYGGPPSPPKLLTPATLDITAWLPDKVIDFTPTPLLDQAELMRLIALIQPPGRAVHGFIGFDPWRQVDDVAKGKPVTALDVVKIAVEQKGFAGVKLYPPMGFRATNNTALGDGDFPMDLTFPYPVLGARLDAALDALYTYCATNDVPIMAHCAASESLNDQYALRADPQFWKLVLDKPAYKNLRLNLGHFGGLWNLDNTAPTPDDPHVCWTPAIVAMIQSASYPNLYTDLGDFSTILDRTAAESAHTQIVLAKLQALVAGTTVPTRIMYGTDWLMLGREPQSQSYYAKMQAQIAVALGVTDLSDLMWRNASRFLGMAPGKATRTRLDAFYTANGASPAVLNAFG